MTDWRNPNTKPEAVAFVSAVLNTPSALKSPDFAVAMTLSTRFDITVKDVLEFRRANGEDHARRFRLGYSGA